MMYERAMRTYSDFFKTIYDETSPTRYLGQGTHHSVLRAIVFHDQNGKPLSEGQFADFAVLWDEDRDERVIEPIEEIYRRGLLPSFLMFGESEAVFTAILSDKALSLTPTEKDERIAFLETAISDICQSLDDAWHSEVVDRHGPNTMNSYLTKLEVRWPLGTAARRRRKPGKRLAR